MVNLKQQEDESVDDYFNRFKSAMDRADLAGLSMFSNDGLSKLETKGANADALSAETEVKVFVPEEDEATSGLLGSKESSADSLQMAFKSAKMDVFEPENTLVIRRGYRQRISGAVGRRRSGSDSRIVWTK